MIGICTDSHSLMPSVLAERYGIEVVPLTVSVDGREYLEGVDLDPDSFYDLYTDDHKPVSECCEPSSGQFAAAYEELVNRGCKQIMSIHSSGLVIGALNAARLAAHTAAVPVRLIDSRTVRFGVSCCVWAAAEALQGGASLDEAAEIAESVAPRLGNVFIIDGLQLLDVPQHAGTIGVWTLVDEEVQPLAKVGSIVDAVNVMAERALGWGDRLKLGVGTAHRECGPIGEALLHAVGESSNVTEVVRYRILPSAGILTGPGTVSCVMFAE